MTTAQINMFNASKALINNFERFRNEHLSHFDDVYSWKWHRDYSTLMIGLPLRGGKTSTIMSLATPNDLVIVEGALMRDNIVKHLNSRALVMTLAGFYQKPCCVAYAKRIFMDVRVKHVPTIFKAYPKMFDENTVRATSIIIFTGY